MEPFTTVYCLFMFSCFAPKIKPVPTLNFKDADKNALPCPKTCDCYLAPEGRFGIDYKYYKYYESNSMVCEGEQNGQFYQYFGSNQLNRPKMRLNTIVLKNLEKYKEKSIVLNAESVVIEGITNFDDLTLDGDFRYLTFYAQEDLRSLPKIVSSKVKGIHILKAGSGIITEFTPPPEGNFMELESFTMRQTTYQTINSETLFTLSPLRTLDLSGNELISIDAIILWDEFTPTIRKNEHLTSLYLNDNKLLSIPTELDLAFPNLRTVHLYGNPIMFIDFAEIKPLLSINECILFATNPNDQNSKEPEIYSIESLQTWIPVSSKQVTKIHDSFPDLERETIKSIGMSDSFQNLNILCENDKKVKHSPEFNFESCPRWKEHPQRLIQKYQTGEMMLRNQVFPVVGELINDLQNGINFEHMNDEHKTFWIRIPGVENILRNHRLILKNALYKAQLLERFVVFRLDSIPLSDSDRRLQEMQRITTILVSFARRPNVIGFELEMLDASFEGLNIDIKLLNGNPGKFIGNCPIAFKSENEKKTLTDVFQKKTSDFANFVTIFPKFLEIQDRNRITGSFGIPVTHSFFVTIDVKGIGLLEMFNDFSIVQKCFGQEPGFMPKINGITIVNIDKMDEHYEKQMKTIADFRKKYDELIFKEEFSGQSQRIISLISKH